MDERPLEPTAVPGTWKLLGGLAAWIVLTYLSLFVLDAATITRLTDEDGFFESLGALAFLVASGLFCFAFLRSRRRGTGSLQPWSELALALVLFVCAGEEISWGQRLLGFETPKTLAAINAQGETTLHNLDWFQGEGHLPIGLNDCFQALWIGLTIVIPSAAALSPRLRELAGRLVPVVPLGFGALFVLTWGLAKAAGIHFRAVDAGVTTHSVVEIKECGYAIAFAGIGLWARRS